MTTQPTSQSPISPIFVIGSMAAAALATLVFMAGAGVMSGGAPIPASRLSVALVVHVGTVVPALFLGAIVLTMKKGTALHKLLGRIWAALMMITAIASFGLGSLTGGISPIHIFSIVTIVSIPLAIWHIRRGNAEAHQRAMAGTYFGLVVAGLFSFIPGRLMGNLVTALF